MTLTRHAALPFVLLSLLFAACGADKPARVPQETSTGLAPVEKEALPLRAGECGAGVPLPELFGTWQLLMAFDSMPDAAQLRQASSDPVAALLFLSGREDITPAIRSRAYEALSLVPDARVRAAYQAVLGDEGAEKMRHAAINGFARAWPQDAAEVVGALLKSDPDPQIRLTAAAALCAFSGDEGRALVEAAAAAEAEGWVREQMTGYARPRRAPKLP